MRKYWMLGMMIWWMTVSVRMLGQQAESRLTDLGPQVSAAMIQGSIFVIDGNGKELLYTVVRGEPAHLLGYEVRTAKLILDEALPGADGAWDLAFTPDGWLYIPGASGVLFRHRPGTDTVENLGMALQGETYVWNLTVGRKNEVFGATYPGCRVFRYHPAEGFSDVGKGPLVHGENYVRSLAYHEPSGLLYAGVGSHAHLVVMDPATGTKKEILPPLYKPMEFVYGLELVKGGDGKDRLLALLTASKQTLVINLGNHQVEREISEMDMKSVWSDSASGQVYFTSKSNLKKFDPAAPAGQAKTLAEGVGSANAFGKGSDGSIRMISAAGVLVTYDPRSGKVKKQQLEIPPQPIPINAILYGPDHKIWMGGYLAGGHATYDPASGKSTRYTGLDQTEGMVVQDKTIYFGIYPHGRFYAFDTERKWDVAQGNPRKLGAIEGQGRSFALVSVPEKQQLLFGMIPEYGKLGGALVMYDAVTDQLASMGEIVPAQAIASLVKTGGLVLGGTTISGGLGIRPTAREAILFGWNIAERKKEFELVPVPGAAAITSLIHGPDGHIWGLAGGTLFIFDAGKRAIVSTHKLFDVPPVTSHVWRGAMMAVHPSGDVYGTGNDHLFKIDARTKTLTLLAQGASLLAMDKDGDIYFKKGKSLMRYRVGTAGR